MAIGVIKKFFEDRGFGFITPDGSRDDVWFHRSVVVGGSVPVAGAPVEFIEKMGPNGRLRAANVRPI